MRRSLAVLFPLLVVGLLAPPATAMPLGPASHPTGLSPYRAPHFRCAKWLRYDSNESPSLPSPANDPLCVEYDKRNITVDNLGAVIFLYQEPWRFAAAGGKCRYWQKDHWRIQVSRPGDPVLVQWDGSYWFDLINGEGGGILRNFRVAGHPADAAAVASLVERVSPEAGAMIRSYGARGGGGGGSAHLNNPTGQC
jgi:hypothetical protein